MPQSHTSSLFDLISVAVAPVVLITATAILLSGYSGKYSGLAGQLRDLTAEYRRPETSDARRRNVKEQIRLFHRRITAMWAASAFLSLALLSFLTTVVSVILAADAKFTHIGIIGVASIILGLILIAAAVLVELYEIRLARLTIAGELADVMMPNPK